MRMLFKRFFAKAELKECTLPLCNPYRGFYQIFTVEIGKETDYDLFTSCLVEAESLVLLLLDIGAYKNEDLDEKALTQIRETLQFFSERKKDLMIRAVYDHEGKALEREPGTFALVKAHLKQIAELIADFENLIFIFQGMLVGNWGEMHTSRFLSKAQLQTLADILHRTLPKQVFMAVRRPVQYRIIDSVYASRKESLDHRMGIFNDALFGSATDMGTYAYSEETDRQSAWVKKDELAFLDKLCENVPLGGEAVLGDGYIDRVTNDEVVADLRTMHATYLNRLYDTKLLDKLKERTYQTKGIWNGKSLYEYVEAHLGYRFLLRKAKYHRIAQTGESLAGSMEIVVENTGFASLYREAKMQLVCVLATGEEKVFTIPGDLRTLKSGKSGEYSVIATLPRGIKDCPLYIQIVLGDQNRKIHFANESKDGRVYIGRLTD